MINSSRTNRNAELANSGTRSMTKNSLLPISKSCPFTNCVCHRNLLTAELPNCVFFGFWPDVSLANFILCLNSKLLVSPITVARCCKG